jgi:LysM repeat protein
MTRLISAQRVAILILLCVWWNGCSFSGESASDEEKDPNYLAGRGRIAALNYAGAIESFEKALETNPRSAAAHLELGLIYYQHVTTNWARAIYHFEKYLELRPKANNADLIRQNVDYCKLGLAKEMPYTLSNDLVRKEVERLARENGDMRQTVEQLKAQLALRPNATPGGETAFNPINASNVNALASAESAPGPNVQHPPAAERQTAPPMSRETARATAASTRAYVVKSGDNPFAIARSYGVKLENLLNANPGLEPRRLQPGQTLVIPLP